MSFNRNDLAELAAVLATEATDRAPNLIARDALMLIRIARRAETLRKKGLSGNFVEHRRNLICKDAAKLLAPYGVKMFTVCGDPHIGRGCVFQIQFASGRSNGKHGMWGVAT